MNHHAHQPSSASREVVNVDYGGWISGPALSPCDACQAGVHCFGATRCPCCRREPEPVPARDIREGDRLAHDGRVLTVTAAPEAAWYVQEGEHVAGLAIACRDGSARWTLRRASELLDRVRTGGAS